MKQVLTMTMNPCIDRTMYFSQFKAGATNYVDNIMEEAAGKGINVAVGLAHIHVPVKAIGFVYEENAKCLFEKLEKERLSGSAAVRISNKSTAFSIGFVG